MQFTACVNLMQLNSGKIALELHQLISILKTILVHAALYKKFTVDCIIVLLCLLFLFHNT